MNEALLQEVPLSALAEIRPEGAANPPVVSMPPASISQFIVPTSLNLLSSYVQASQNMDADIQARWANVLVL